MGKKRRNRNRNLINVKISAPEFPDPVSVDNMYQPIAKRATIIRPNFSVSSSLPQPVQVHPFSVIPSRFSTNSIPQRWLSPIPFWHAKSVFPPNPFSLPVAIVAPLERVRFARCDAKAGPITSTVTAFNSVKTSSIQTSTKKSTLPVAPSDENQKASLQVSDQTADVGTRETEYCTTVNVSSDRDTDSVKMQSATDKITESSVDTGERDTLLNEETPTEEDDVIFLYCVEPEKGKLIEVVNLSEDTNEISSDRNLVLMSSRNPDSSKDTDIKQDPRKNSSLDSQEVLEIYSSTSKLPNSKGPDLRTRAGRKRKREENSDAHCRVCHRVDKGACKDAILMFISKCGHIFCMTCLKQLVPYKCTECNAGISNLSKVTF